MHEKVQSFIDQLPPLQNDTSFEVRWSLSELEDIVFEFINAHDLPNEFKAAMPWTNKEEDKGGKEGKDPKIATLKRSSLVAKDDLKGKGASKADGRSAGGKSSSPPPKR